MDIELGKRVVGLHRRILKHFNQGDWEAIGLLTGQRELVVEHGRLLRSLSWNDPDYSGHALSVLSMIVELDPSWLAVIQGYLDDNYPEPVKRPSEADQKPVPSVDVPPESTTRYQYDVALSFAGEEREYVKDVAAKLKVAKLKAAVVRVFYDDYEKASLWGKDLGDHLAEVYGKLARFVVIFVSKSYAAKAWPTHERRAAQARAIKEQKVVILPARFDDTPVPGLPDTVGYVDLKKTSMDELVALVIEKLAEDA